MTTSRTSHMTDYEAERKHFHLDVPEYFNFAIDVIGKWAHDPNKLAMFWVGQNNEMEQITFAQFAERSSRAANAFASAGIVKGERVLLMLPRIPEWWEVALGLFKLGAIPIPCTTLLTPKDLQFRSEIAEPIAIITDSEGASKFDQVREQCPSVRVSVLAEHTHSGAQHEGWLNYQAILRDASPEFTGPKTRSDDPFHLISAVITFYLLPVGLLVMAWLAMRRAPWLASIGAFLVLLGMLPLPALAAAVESLTYDIVRMGSNPLLITMVKQFNNDVVMSFYNIVDVPGVVLGPALIGLALWRARAVPIWAAVLITFSRLVVFLFPFFPSLPGVYLQLPSCILLFIGSIPATLAMLKIPYNEGQRTAGIQAKTLSPT